MTACKTSAVAGLADTAAVNEGGSWTVMGEARLALAVSGAPLFRSDPVKLAPSVSEPALEGVQVQVSVESTPGFTTCGRGGVAAVQIPVGDAVKVATVAEAPPGSFTVSWTVSTSPTLAAVGFPTTAMEAESARRRLYRHRRRQGRRRRHREPGVRVRPRRRPAEGERAGARRGAGEAEDLRAVCGDVGRPRSHRPAGRRGRTRESRRHRHALRLRSPAVSHRDGTVMSCPTSAVPGVADTVAVSAGGSWTAMGVERLALAVSAAPVLPSEPVNDAPRVSEPALEGVQVQVKVELTPEVTPCGGTGVAAVQIPEGDGVTVETVPAPHRCRSP